MTGALADLRVLDLTQFLAGPYCTQVLGDLGADIIKVEPPAGDSSRTPPPHYVAGDSAYFLSANRNKRSIVIDLRNRDGLALAKRLALKADVLVENNRPGVLARLGLDFEALRAENPGLIWCAITGFGQDGPYRDRPAYDMIVQAMSGGMSMTGEVGGPPVRAGVPLGDISAGLYGAIAVLAALHERARTGKGRMIDVAMLDCQVAMASYQASYHLNGGVTPQRQGRGHDSIPTYRAFTAADGRDVLITANTEKMWRALCDVLGRPEWKADPRFALNIDRNRHRDALIPLLEEAFAARPAEAWLAALTQAEIPCAPVNDMGQVFTDPHVLQRGMKLAVQGQSAAQRACVAGNPLHMGDGVRTQHLYPPALGQDGAAILRDVLGITPGEQQALAAAGAWLDAEAAARTRAR